MQLASTQRLVDRTWQKTLLGRFLAGRRAFTSSLAQWAAAGSEENAKITFAGTRNIGIIAHIDAGKTTTTERMLHYSGFTRRIGNVDEGSTVTDFLPAERARGITIQSAAITFHWPPLVEQNHRSTEHRDQVQQSYIINLIDTPGHADFTFEVLRALRVLDGAVCILDGVAGVEAQTEKVWCQAQAYGIPKLVYVNKLDREGAAFGRTVREVASKLRVWPAVCQLPWFENDSGRFQGVVDVVKLRAFKWKESGNGKSIVATRLDDLENSDPKLVKEARKARTALVELLSEHDDFMIEKFLECDEDHLAIPFQDIIISLRRCILDGKSNVVPIYAGASFRNIGVQPLLDAVTSLLPSPEEALDPEFKANGICGGLRDLVADRQSLPISANPQRSRTATSAKKPLMPSGKHLRACALAFKVTNDQRRGVLVYVRVYHGSLKQGAIIFNTNLQTTERIPRLLRMYARDADEILSIDEGQIGVITGLKHARTGDTLISYTGMNPRNGPPSPLNDLQLRPIEIPPPVFFASVEPQSLGEEASVESALALLLREDPSLQLSTNEDSGQRLLSGMGELHLEIARDRLIQDLKAKATMGRIEIGYRESISAPGIPKTVLFDRDIAGRHGKAGCVACVGQTIDIDDDTSSYENTTGLISILQRDGNRIDVTIAVPEGQEARLDKLFPAHLTIQTIHSSLQNGALAALSRGPLYSYPQHSTHVVITIDQTKHIFGTSTTPASLSSAARLATEASLRSSIQAKPSILMEPVMKVVISVDEASLGAVVHDISSSRGGKVVSLDDTDVLGSGFGASGSAVDTRRVYSPPDPFETPALVGLDGLTATNNESRQKNIIARVPLKEMVGYLKHLRSYTAGRGTFIMSVDRFEKMNSQREKLALGEIRGTQ